MTKARCATTVYGSGNFGGWPCIKPVKVERNGMMYCTIHDPEYVKAKNDKRQLKWEKEFADNQAECLRHRGAANESARRLALFPEMLEALKTLLDKYDRNLGQHWENARALVAKAEKSNA